MEHVQHERDVSSVARILVHSYNIPMNLRVSLRGGLQCLQPQLCEELALKLDLWQLRSRVAWSSKI